MTPRAAALATALATTTAKDWRWMETHDGAQYAALRLPSGVVVTVTAPAHASPDDVARQVRAALELECRP